MKHMLLYEIYMPAQVKFEFSGMSAVESEVIRGSMAQPEP